MEVILYIDTCNREMCVGLSIGDKLVYKVQYEAFKRQSEVAAVEISKCLKECKVKASELTKIVVTNGPGSYTGIRIGLTLAKVMSKVLKIKLVCLSSLRVMRGNTSCSAIIDAKGGRVYYNKDNDCIKYISELDLGEEYVGDTYLIGKESEKIDIIENMFCLRNEKEVSDIDSVKAIYLKD